MPRNKKPKEKEDERLKDTLRSLTENDEHANMHDSAEADTNEIRPTGKATDRLDVEEGDTTRENDR
jgi:hypothetical protein